MLKEDIGLNSGIIWHLLFDNGTLSVRQIGELTGYKDKMIVLSLGWLAREDKINFVEKNDTIYIELKPSFQEIYY
ncbi:MAG: winged helix-turn-helix domain-containing protein [Dysgonomonas sp.]|nr:winged helix-turn-helix domain-containing protein [Dysgonomonas sp.]